MTGHVNSKGRLLGGFSDTEDLLDDRQQNIKNQAKATERLPEPLSSAADLCGKLQVILS